MNRHNGGYDRFTLFVLFRSCSWNWFIAGKTYNAGGGVDQLDLHILMQFGVPFQMSCKLTTECCQYVYGAARPGLSGARISDYCSPLIDRNNRRGQVSRTQSSI